MNIFEQASIEKFRFDSIKGPLSTEQLWDMPLTSKTGFDLDTVAKTVNLDLKAVTEDSFVATRTNVAQGVLSTKLEVVKHIIASKLEMAKKKEDAAARATERAVLGNILLQKKQEALLDLTPEELQKRIDQLG